eukprot:jgi/Astpho2/3450/Aster-07048
MEQPAHSQHQAQESLQGLRTVIITDSEELGTQHLHDAAKHRELWLFYPDDNPVRSYLAGDSRAAVAPFLAHARLHHDSYKWMLFGDDDTVFFIDNIADFLSDFDPQIPYFISDNNWWSDHGHQVDKGFHPHPFSPRCRPCHSNLTDDDILRDYKPPVGCPCTPYLLCLNDLQLGFNAWCDMPRVPFRSYSFHGGAGAILSVGLLNAVNYTELEMCVHATKAPGGDSMLQVCLWQQGFATTDPGMGLTDTNIQMFDPGTEDRQGLMRGWAAAMEGRCDAACQGKLKHTLTLHLKSSAFEVLGWAAEYMRALSRMYTAYRAWVKDNAVMSPKDVEARKVARDASKAEFTAKGVQAWLDAAGDALAWEQQRRDQWAAMSLEQREELRASQWSQMRAEQQARPLAGGSAALAQPQHAGGSANT